MKRNLIMFFLFVFVFNVSGQHKNASDSVIITSEKTATRVYTENGELHINVPPEEVTKFKTTGYVRYKDFGAKGDGKTDDLEAIAATHAFANSYGLPVKADDGATYYIGGKDRTAGSGRCRSSSRETSIRRGKSPASRRTRSGHRLGIDRQKRYALRIKQHRPPDRQ